VALPLLRSYGFASSFSPAFLFSQDSCYGRAA
jgi:hypothetical protein